MFDREIVVSIIDGNPRGLAAAYDQYAPGLYAYCRSLLAEPADAADAVHDTFVIAAAKVSGLRDPERLRAWLYAVARNECHGRLRASAAATPLDEAAEMSDDIADLGHHVEQAELRDLVWAALSGLNPGEREVIELNLRHELDGADLADVLGVPRNQAHALASRARSQFETSLGVLLVARTGREFCPDLAAILEGWDGELTVLIRKRVNRHIERCEVCGERRRNELSPAMLLGLLPVAMLPAGLRADLMHLVADVSPDARSWRAEVADRAEPFGSTGFPVQDTPPPVPRARSSYLTAAIGAVAALVVLGGVAFMLLGGHGGPSASGASGAPGGAAATPVSLPAGPAPSGAKPSLSLIAPVSTTGAPIQPTPTATQAKAKAKATPKLSATPKASPTPTKASPTPTPTKASPSPTPTKASPTPSLPIPTITVTASVSTSSPAALASSVLPPSLLTITGQL